MYTSWAHEKMLNITNYQRNVNQNYNEIPPHTSKNGHHQKVNKKYGAEIVAKRKPYYTFDGNIKFMQPLQKTVWTLF